MRHRGARARAATNRHARRRPSPRPGLPNTCRGTGATGLRWPSAASSRPRLGPETGAAQESVRDAERARPVDGVEAQDAVASAGHDATHFFLGVVEVVQARDAVHRDARAVERRADLRRPDELAVLHEEAPRGPGVAHVRLHGIAAMRLPLAQEALGAEDVQLVVDLAALAAHGREHPPAVARAMD